MSVGYAKPRIMPILAGIPLTLILLQPAHAREDEDRAASLGPAPVSWCSDKGGAVQWPECKSGTLTAQERRMEAALRAALANVSATASPLLKRDQAWFREMPDTYLENSSHLNAEDRERLIERIESRIAGLTAMAAVRPAGSVAGRWINAFGSVEVVAAASGGVKVSSETSGDYSADDEKRPSCSVEAALQPVADGWLAGEVTGKAPDAIGRLRARRQGDTLRVIAIESRNGEPAFDCSGPHQLTGTYFLSESGSGQANAGQAPFVAPSFDCRKPATQSEEEICADPELAANDVRLNSAWKALAPRLDQATHKWLLDDQKRWVLAQKAQFPIFLHPAWEKRTYEVHFTSTARRKLDQLQRERIALLEGFDEKRVGLAGHWLAYNAELSVKITPDGKLTAAGWKWFQGDWKAGCEYEMSGSFKGGTFRAAEGRTNPDTLERDGAMLIVNRHDEIAAKRRGERRDKGTGEDDEQKCRRSVTIPSTARLFPVRPSPDIDVRDGEIR